LNLLCYYEKKHKLIFIGQGMDGSIANDLFTVVGIVGKSLTDVEVPGFT
jgi:hypothetical protein